jgi:hypothetical protein
MEEEETEGGKEDATELELSTEDKSSDNSSRPPISINFEEIKLFLFPSPPFLISKSNKDDKHINKEFM